MAIRHLLAASAAALIAAIPLPSGAGAESAFDAGNSVIIKSATMTSAQPGEKAYIHFVLVNEGAARIHLIELQTPVADHVYLMGRVAPDEMRDLGSIGVGPEEVLDATSPHLRYETAPVARALVPGERVNVTFDFVDWTVTVPIQVQAAMSGL